MLVVLLIATIGVLLVGQDNHTMRGTYFQWWQSSQESYKMQFSTMFVQFVLSMI